MAFNPFDVFRRNQRILFAVLTVFVMFMFVLSSGLGGGGDFFDWLPQWLGSQSRRGDTVATLGGNRVTTSQLDDVAQQRRLANRYMILATERTRANLAKFVADNQQRVSQANEPFVKFAYSTHLALTRIGTPMFTQADVQALQNIDQVMAFLGQVLTKNDLSDDDREVVSATLSLLEADLRTVRGGADQQYFTNAGNTTGRDRLDFLLWQKKANQLGINLTVKDMEVLLDAEFQGQLNNDDRIELTKAFQDVPGYTPDALRQALVEEFEVRIAQQAVMGSEFVRLQGAPQGTPYGYYDFYREKTAQAQFGIVRIPVSNYIDKVEGEPKESELRALFAKHRNVVPNPASPEPGFREPRRLKLSWLEVQGNEPYYTKEAERTLGMIPAVFGLSVVGQATNPLNAIAATVIADSPDLLLDAEAKSYRAEYDRQLDDRWFKSPIDSPVTDGTVGKPATIGSLAGIFAGNAVSGGPALSSIAAVYDTVNTIEHQARLKTLPSALIVPIMGGPAILDSVLLPVIAQAAATPPPSFASSKPELTQRVTTQIAENLALRDLEKFQTELTKRGSGVDPDAAKRYAEEFVKERGLKSGTSKELRDAFTIGDDPGLEPMAKLVSQPHSNGINLRIGQQFFYQQDAETQRVIPTEGLYRPEPYPAPELAEPTAEQPVMMVWRSDEQKQGTAPRSLNDPGVKEKVVAAWREQQARELAKKDAEQFVKDWQEIVKTKNLVQNSPSIDNELIQLRTQFAIKFEDPAKEEAIAYEVLDGVGPLKTLPDPTGQGQMQLNEFQLTPTAEIPYPTLEMQKKLLEQQKGPLANAEILVDDPKSNYYVSVLERDTKNSSGQFSFMIYRPISPVFAGMQNGIQRRYQAELREEARKRAIALMKAEFGYDKENAEFLDTNDEV